MQAAARSSQNRRNPPRAMPLKLARFWLICVLFALWACAIAGRLFWLQVVRHDEFQERAQKQQQRTFEVAPRRGVLYDRNLHELAMTVQVDSIYAVPTEIDDKQTAAHALAALVHTDPEDGQTTEEKELLVSIGRRVEKRARNGCTSAAPRHEPIECVTERCCNHRHRSQTEVPQAQENAGQSRDAEAE